MKKRKVWRYTCEFCGKSGCSGGHMKVHEASCTANPHRVCRMCKHSPKDTAALVALLQAPGNTTADWQAKMIDLRFQTDGCPACILAAIRQSKVQRTLADCDPEPGGGFTLADPMYWDSAEARAIGAPGMKCLGFDFKAERDAFLAERADSGASYY